MIKIPLTVKGAELLKAELARLAEQAAEKRRDGQFRLPVDRVFTVAGFGTVVTGTLLSGAVGEGDAVALIGGARERFDAILLDIDNGPGSMVHEANHRLYGHAGIAACREALRQLLLVSSVPENDRTKAPGASERSFFAFKLHQFISGAGYAYATLEKPGQRFVTVDGREALTRPIKGTRRRRADPADDERVRAELDDY